MIAFNSEGGTQTCGLPCGVAHGLAPRFFYRGVGRGAAFAFLVALVLGLSTSLAFASPVQMQSDSLSLRFDADAGAVSRAALVEPRFLEANGEAHELVTTDKGPYLPFRLDLEGPDGKRLPITWTAAHEDDAVVFQGNTSGLRLERRLDFGEGSYVVRERLKVTRTQGPVTPFRLRHATAHYVSQADSGGGFFFAARSPAQTQGVCRADGETYRKDADALEAQHGYGPGVRFAGLADAYFANVLAFPEAMPARCGLHASARGGIPGDPAGTLFEAWTTSAWERLSVGESITRSAMLFVGPKSASALRTAGAELSEVQDLGFFASIATYLSKLLGLIHDVVGNWGVSIILLTLLVKLVLYPLTEKSFQSMAKMRQLKPELDAVQAKFGDDRERKGVAMMELYRKHRINPLGGCLPTVLQLPVWFSLYASLSTNVELYHAPFLWWLQDLSAPDPFYVLPIMSGALMYLQQRMTPTAMDPAQAKMMLYFMPVMISVFMLFLPAGLCLYMVTNSALGMAQQKFIQVRLDRASNAKSKPTEGDAEDADPSGTESKQTRRSAYNGG